MRVLHPVTPREKLVASGVYRYFRAGELLRGEEHFSVHALPDDSWFVRVDYDWRALDGTSQLIEALLDPQDAGGGFQRIVAQLHGPAGIMKETFDFHPDRLLIGLSGPKRERRDIELAMTPGYAVVMLKTTLVGLAAARWPRSDRRLIPSFAGYRTPEEKPLVFDATLHEIRHEEIKIGGETRQCRVVDLTGEFAQTLWLDRSGIALRRTTGEINVNLTNYAHGVGV